MQIITPSHAAARLRGVSTVSASGFCGTCRPETVSTATRFPAAGKPARRTLRWATSAANRKTRLRGIVGARGVVAIDNVMARRA